MILRVVGTWGRRPDVGVITGAVTLAAVISLDLLTGVQLSGAYAVAAIVAAMLTSTARTAMVATAAVAAALAAGTWRHNLGTKDWLVRALICLCLAAVAVLSAELRNRREERLRRMTVIAETAQRAVLRAMPTAIGSIGFAARYLSASAEALVGGDLYEVTATPYGVRVIIGDVRGKGLDAVQTAAAVLGAFRQAAFSEPDVVRVAKVLDEIIARVTDDEEFVTALLAEFGSDGCVRLANCGHHPPLLVRHDGHAGLVDTGEPTLPLGLGALPSLAQVPWPAGARMLFYTDGLVEARDDDGVFFPLDGYAAQLSAGSLESALDKLVGQLARFTRDRLHDDMALVIAEAR